MRKREGVVAVIAVSLMIFSLAAVADATFDEGDPKMRVPEEVARVLNLSMDKNDKVTIKKIGSYARDRAAKYGLLILVEFGEDLTFERLELMRQNEPDRYRRFENYYSMAGSWTKIGVDATGFIGEDLRKILRKELNEK